MRWVLLCGAGALFAAGAVLSFKDFATAAGLTYAAAVMCLIFAFLSRFKTFSGLGIKAEMWEDKQQEAAELIDRLKKLAMATAQPLLTMAPRMGRTGRHLSRRELHEAVTRIEDVLREAGLSNDEIESLKRDYHRTSMFDQTLSIRNAANEWIHERMDGPRSEAVMIPTPIAGENIQKYRELNERVRALDAGLERINVARQNPIFEQIPGQLEAAIMALPDFTDAEKLAFMEEHRESFEDIRYYAREKKLRRPAVWLTEDNTAV